jgi:NitT/TauT family transport system substrate-binding protein
MKRLPTLARIVLAGALLALTVAPGSAQAPAPQKVSMILNWIAGGDHAPYYYALKMGWYKDAGIDLDLEQGKGSGLAATRVGTGADQFGLSDLGTVMNARGKGADDVAIMNVYANFPEGFYWLKNSTTIKTPADIAGKKIGNPPADAGRVLWPAFAAANHLNPDSVTWVNIEPNAKISALASHAVDVVTEFYNFHHGYVKAFGSNLGYMAWKDAGVNPYGNSIIVNGDYMRAHKDVVTAFVHVTQRAFAACVAKPDPCIAALVDANSGLNVDNETQNWHEVEQLMDDHDFHTIALGWFNPQRVASDYALFKGTMGIDKPFDPSSVFSDAFLDKSIKMGPAK